MKCKFCDRVPNEIGGFLARMNEKGVPGIWECSPNCNVNMTDADKFLATIDTTPLTPAEIAEAESDRGIPK